MDPNNEYIPLYLEIEPFEIGHCAMCHEEISLAGRILHHIALCDYCSRLILEADASGN